MTWSSWSNQIDIYFTISIDQHQLPFILDWKKLIDLILCRLIQLISLLDLLVPMKLIHTTIFKSIGLKCCHSIDLLALNKVFLSFVLLWQVQQLVKRMHNVPIIWHFWLITVSMAQPPTTTTTTSINISVPCKDVYSTSWSIFFPNRARPGSIFFPISFFLLACFTLILTLSMALNWSTVH